MLANHGHHGLSGEDFAGAAVSRPRSHHRTVKHGETLFADGDRRHTAYRVLRGALCHYVVWPDGSHDVIEFVFPGDIVGLGHLQDHVSTAQAMVDTEVTCLSEADLSRALAADASLSARLASAADREFDVVRRRALGTGRRTPLHRVASYILAVAHMDCASGETGDILADLKSGPALANLLEIGAADLTAALADLEARGLVATTPVGVVIRDRLGLEALSDA